MNRLVNESILEGYGIRTDVLPIEAGQKEGGNRPLRREVRRQCPRGQHGDSLWSCAAAEPIWITPPRWACSTSSARAA